MHYYRINYIVSANAPTPLPTWTVFCSQNTADQEKVETYLRNLHPDGVVRLIELPIEITQEQFEAIKAELGIGPSEC